MLREEFRPTLERAWRKPDAERKSRAGRKPMDAVPMFRTPVPSALYNLSDDRIEYQVRDRLSFMRFPGLGLEDRVPDAKTVRLYREGLAQAGPVESLFSQFDGFLSRQGYIARGGQILDASIVPVPRNHNTRDENRTIRNGKVPQDWSGTPAKRSRKDTDARWTGKHGKSHYGYRNHVNVDRKHKLVRPYHPSIYPHLPELVYFGKARERPPDGAQACPEEGTQGSSSFPDPLFSPRCATGCSSFAPVETARYTAIAGTGMSRSSRSGFLIRLRVMPKPRVLKSENIASMLRRIPWSGTLYSDGAAFMAIIHGSLWPSSWSTPMVEKTPVP